MVGWVQKDLGSVACSLDAGLHVGKGDRDFMHTSGHDIPGAWTPAGYVDDRQQAAGSWRQEAAVLESSSRASHWLCADGPWRDCVLQGDGEEIPRVVATVRFVLNDF